MLRRGNCKLVLGPSFFLSATLTEWVECCCWYEECVPYNKDSIFFRFFFHNSKSDSANSIPPLVAWLSSLSPRRQQLDQQHKQKTRKTDEWKVPFLKDYCECLDRRSSSLRSFFNNSNGNSPEACPVFLYFSVISFITTIVHARHLHRSAQEETQLEAGTKHFKCKFNVCILEQERRLPCHSSTIGRHRSLYFSFRLLSEKSPS